jgi:hypothetical protein
VDTSLVIRISNKTRIKIRILFMTAADVLVEALMDWGVEVIFGLPGDGINGIMESLRTRHDKSDSFRPVTKRLPLSWPAVMPNTRASSAFAWQHPGPAESIF